jgi:hypothetical protein
LKPKNRKYSVRNQCLILDKIAYHAVALHGQVYRVEKRSTSQNGRVCDDNERGNFIVIGGGGGTGAPPMISPSMLAAVVVFRQLVFCEWRRNTAVTLGNLF